MKKWTVIISSALLAFVWVFAKEERAAAQAKTSAQMKNTSVRSKMGRMAPHPGVFVSFGFAEDKRVANKRVAAYRAWKSVRKMEGWDSSEPFGQILS